MVMAGFALQGISNFFPGAPLGDPTSEIFSNPGVPYAPLFFILGVMLILLAALVKELQPDKENR